VEPALGVTLADALLAPHRPYLPCFSRTWIRSKRWPISPAGGFYDNIPRVLPASPRRSDRPRSLACPADLSADPGNAARSPTRRCIASSTWASAWWRVVDPEQVAAFRAAIPEETWVIGRLVARTAGAPAVEIEGM
jgi:hypothetical protein